MHDCTYIYAKKLTSAESLLFCMVPYVAPLGQFPLYKLYKSQCISYLRPQEKRKKKLETEIETIKVAPGGIRAFKVVDLAKCKRLRNRRNRKKGFERQFCNFMT